MIYNNAAVTEKDILGFGGFLNKLIPVKRKKKTTAEQTEAEDDGFIAEEDIIQRPRSGSKVYFVRSCDFEKIKEIYKTAAEVFSSVSISEEEYSALFKPYNKFRFSFYDASGYTLTEKEYAKFFEIYCCYAAAFDKIKDGSL